MGINRIEKALSQLKDITDKELVRELKELNPTISNEKYNNAFSCDAAVRILEYLPDSEIDKAGRIPKSELYYLRKRMVFLFLGYINLVYMRSTHLERELDRPLRVDSPLIYFRDIFRSGSIKKGEDTIIQHIRNSLCHGDIILDFTNLEVQFTDREWNISLPLLQYQNLCEQVGRYFMCAYEAMRR